jgi:hypothetical protein
VAASQNDDRQSTPDQRSFEIIYIVGDCPLQLRCRDIEPPWSDAPYWITEIIKRTERLAQASNGLMMFMPGVVDDKKLARLA